MSDHSVGVSRGACAGCVPGVYIGWYLPGVHREGIYRVVYPSYIPGEAYTGINLPNSPRFGGKTGLKPP